MLRLKTSLKPTAKRRRDVNTWGKPTTHPVDSHQPTIRNEEARLRWNQTLVTALVNEAGSIFG